MSATITRLTLLSALGLYPPRDVETGYGRLVINDDISFVVTRAGRDRSSIELGRQSEVEYLTVEEIRFLGCLTVAWPELYGILRIYPIPGHMELSLDLTGPRDAFVDAARRQAHIVQADNHTAADVIGPAVGGPCYRHKDRDIDQALVEKLCSRVSLSAHLLIRGLGALVRSDMLSVRQEFLEPATMMLHISLAATQEIILELLRQEGISNPSSKHASDRLATAFGDPPRGDNYFEEYYEDRITIVHPKSRHGTFGYPPLAADDFFDLRPDLIAVLYWLISGEIPPRETPNSWQGT